MGSFLVLWYGKRHFWALIRLRSQCMHLDYHFLTNSSLGCSWFKFTGIISLLLVKICKVSFLPTYNQFSWFKDVSTFSTVSLFIQILIKDLLQIQATVFRHFVHTIQAFMVRHKCCREGSRPNMVAFMKYGLYTRHS